MGDPSPEQLEEAMGFLFENMSEPERQRMLVEIGKVSPLLPKDPPPVGLFQQSDAPYRERAYGDPHRMIGQHRGHDAARLAYDELKQAEHASVGPLTAEDLYAAVQYTDQPLVAPVEIVNEPLPHHPGEWRTVPNRAARRKAARRR